MTSTEPEIDSGQQFSDNKQEQEIMQSEEEGRGFASNTASGLFCTGTRGSAEIQACMPHIPMLLW